MYEYLSCNFWYINTEHLQQNDTKLLMSPVNLTQWVQISI